MIELPKQYSPKETEDKWYKSWEEKNLFSAKPNPQKKPFCIVIPPPNVTGILHMGHALNNSIQDILIRYHRMKGFEALWMPGTDHAGIATQNVVEKALAKEGLTRRELGREKFIERVWLWKEEYGSTIIRQLKKLGASCDWQRTRFTMDEEYSKAVREVFVRLWDKGFIYQDNKVINWCPRCSTALADEEAPHREIQGNLYYIKYPLMEKGLSPKGTVPDFIVVATTRPETMLGDTAVAVNPKDKRYKHLVGKILILPLLNREIKIIADPMVDMKFGTGAVKVTPAHDPNDYILGKKHDLEFINIMHPDGRMNENAQDYRGMDRFEAREVILEDLKEKGLLKEVQPHSLSAGHCYRCHTIIEPYLSKQWFVKMKPLSKPALEAVRNGTIKFYPKRWTKVYLNWMENIQDWCISRQIWWGHRIPIWYCLDCREITVAVDTPKECKKCGSRNLKQDEDVLDTWFSSWLWPFATVPKNDLDYFYPTSTLVTAPEIIFFWVARMIMAGFEFMDKEPFRDVYIHGTVRDIEGKKMSKSLGNIIDPLEIINEYGADALRFSIILQTAQGQDVFLSKERFEQGRNFANKIWNASRFILMNLDEGQSPEGTVPHLCDFFQKENLSLVNRWILSRFYTTAEDAYEAIENHRLNEAANTLYRFFWHEFCDWYLEIIKPEIREMQNQVIMYKVLEKFLRVLHPFMPFVTEEIWQRVQGLSPQGTVPANKSIMTEPLPHIQEQIIDKKCEKQAQLLFGVITEIRNLRAQLEIKPDQKIRVALYAHAMPKQRIIKENSGLIINLARLAVLEFLGENRRPESTLSAVTQDADIYLYYNGLLDIKKEKGKIQSEMESLRNFKKTKEGLLKNKDFVKNAPDEIVEKARADIAEITEKLKRMEKISHELL